MRSSVSLSQACGSTSLSLAVVSSVAIVAQVRPPPSDPAKNAFLRVMVCGRIVRSTVLYLACNQIIRDVLVLAALPSLSWYGSEHQDRGVGSTEGGQAELTMSCELALLSGRPCD
jgi:hypothetical protein